MLVVIDANELFSLLIKGSRLSNEIFLSKNVELIAPEFLLNELANHKDELLFKTHRTDAEFSKLLSVFKDRVRLIPEQEFCQFIPKANELFPEHTKDVSYFALALKFNCLIWSEEKLLKKQVKVPVLNTKKLFDKLNSFSPSSDSSAIFL
ncbi:MAG: PIN domain-containing protein [Nanoarchaeota archaeon]